MRRYKKIAILLLTLCVLTAATATGISALDMQQQEVASSTQAAPAIRWVESIKLNNTKLNWPIGKTGFFKATVSPEDAMNRSVIWTSDNTKVATVDSSGKLTSVGVGTATITCMAADGSNVKETCTVTVYQQAKSIKLNNTKLNWPVGKTGNFKAVVSPSNAANKAVTWKSSNTKVATVDNKGKLTSVGTGTATITCTAKDGNGAKATCTVTVYQKAESIKLNNTKLNWPIGKTGNFKATVNPSNTTNKAVTWKSSNTKVATVDSNGKLKSVGVGTATITCTAKDGSGVKVTCKVTVYQQVKSIKLNNTQLNWPVGKTGNFKAAVNPSNAANKAVTWKSSNTKVATVDSKGKLKSIAPGTATITCTAKDGNGAKATCKVTVFRQVTKITLNNTTLNWKVGKSGNFKATVTPANATNKAVTWKSSNTKVATVNSNGRLTSVGEGTATITCTAKDGSGAKATCKVTVKGFKYGTTSKKQYDAVVSKCKSLINSQEYKQTYNYMKEYLYHEIGEIFEVAPSDQLCKFYAAIGILLTEVGDIEKMYDIPSCNAYYTLVEGKHGSGVTDAALMAMADQLGILQGGRIWYSKTAKEGWGDYKINGEWILFGDPWWYDDAKVVWKL